MGAYQDPSILPLELPELHSKWDLVIHCTARLQTQGMSVAYFNRAFSNMRMSNGSWHMAGPGPQLDLQGSCRHTGLIDAGDLELV